ncbi:hypothetical protein [Granulicella arctica]|uniref:hypothetical protein n=1 Tax=Granulicella arctica TaxID=940613 RepID=UPI0021DFC96B|nr:hypothetical protein [Granulicella arctica]
MARSDEKELTKYQREKLEKTPKEFGCGILHSSIEEALIHAQMNLGIRSSTGVVLVPTMPYLGTMGHNSGTVVGWQVNANKRYRLDVDRNLNHTFYGKRPAVVFDPEGLTLSEMIALKGPQGVHVNEEDFTRATRQRISHPTESIAERADTYWRKWSKQFGVPGFIKAEDL